MPLKTLEKVNPEKLKQKRVLVRADFNVAINKGRITEDFRIKATLPTIEFLREQKAKIILLSHLGEPEPFRSLIKKSPLKAAAKDFSLKPIAKHLGALLKKDVQFISDCVGKRVEKAIEKMKPGDILLLENVRFYEEETRNDEEFAKRLAQNADYFINDAFAVCHRGHASVAAVAKYLPSSAGFLLSREVEVLGRAYTHPKKPLCIVMGGGKVTTKLNLILRFFDKADQILIGGSLANTLLGAKGYGVGKSKIEDNISERLKNLDLTSTKIHLPLDMVVAKRITKDAAVEIKVAGGIAADDIILDLGPDTVELFSHIIEEARMIIWNGPLGYFELEKFANGTREFAKALTKTKAFTIIGGGDTIAAVDELGILDKFDFVSTGGGAMLDFLAGEKLPGVEALKV